MTEENAQVVENQEQVNENQNKPEKVPMPPEIQERFNKLYKEAKQSKERGALLESQLLKIQSAAESLQERLNAKENRDAIASLKSELRAARESGDDEQIERIQDKLTELMVEEKLEKKIKPKTENVQQPEIKEAVNVMSSSEARITAKWANETDEEGDLVRPWAALSDHPKSAQAADYLADLIQDEQYSELTIKEKLAMVDEKFGKKTVVKRGINAVGEGSLTKPTEKQDTKLTPEQKQVAYRLFSKLTREEAEKKYLNGLKLTGGR